MKGYQTPRRRMTRLVKLAFWSTYSPRSSLLGELAQEGQLRSPDYRGSSGVSSAPRYARTDRKQAKTKRRRAHMARLRNVTLRSSTTAFARAGVLSPDTATRPAEEFYKHPEWGTIKLNPHVKPEQRHRAAHRVERQAAARAVRRASLASLQRDIETANMLERVQRLFAGFGRGGIRTSRGPAA